MTNTNQTDERPLSLDEVAAKINRRVESAYVTVADDARTLADRLIQITDRAVARTRDDGHGGSVKITAADLAFGVPGIARDLAELAQALGRLGVLESTRDLLDRVAVEPDPTLATAVDALRVLTLTPATVAFLQANDPKALEQAHRAIVGA